jgi:hypothetical protein
MQAFTASTFGAFTFGSWAGFGPRAAECPDANVVATSTGSAANSDRRIDASFDFGVCE